MTSAWAFLFSAFLLLGGCTHLDHLEKGIREHDLAGGWRSESGAYLEIGCAGSFSLGQADAAPISWGRHNNSAHLSEVSERSFTVSRFPLSGLKYDVQAWPHQSGVETLMRADGMIWRRVRAFDCP